MGVIMAQAIWLLVLGFLLATSFLTLTEALCVGGNGQGESTQGGDGVQKESGLIVETKSSSSEVSINNADEGTKSNGKGLVDDSSAPIHGGGHLLQQRHRRSVNSRFMVEVDQMHKYLIELTSKRFANYKTQLSPFLCYASPIQESQQWMKYIFIRRGCPIESGVEILHDESPIIRMTVPGIKFRAARYPGVQVKCHIRACLARNSSYAYLCQTRCPGSSSHVKRRDLSAAVAEENIEVKYVTVNARMRRVK